MDEKILIINGNEQDGRDIAVALNKVGYDDIAFAETGEECLIKAKSFDPNIIILDVHLPDTKGFKVCRELRNIKGLNVQIVMISSVEEAGDVVGARIVGADGFAAKTDDYDVLIQSVKRLNENQ